MDIRDIMSIEEFQFKFILEAELRGVELEIGKTRTVNREVTAVTLRDGGNVRATVYLEDLYGKYMTGQAIEDIVDKVIDTLNYADEHGFEVPTFKGPDAKNNLYCVAINKNMNKDIFYKVPHQIIEGTDLALVARYRVGENVSCLVDNLICRDMRLTSDEVLQIAKENTLTEGYTFKGMDQVLKELGGITEEEIREYVGDDYNQQEKKMYVLTNPRSLYGAALISSKQVLGEV
ncbi:MAG: hypothetical protein IJZ96_09055 [Lachnospiraceae bacterium]|nr:hypothetical protein [Lachnospiraceae bacterium]